MRPRDPNPAPLITAAELAEILALAPPARPVVLDVRYPGIGLPDDGRDQYLAGHVPGAAYVSLDDALAAPHVPATQHAKSIVPAFFRNAHTRSHVCRLEADGTEVGRIFALHIL